jgi:hypothetical protein
VSEGAWLEVAVGLVGALLVVGFALTFGHAAALSMCGRLLAPRVAGGQRAIAAAADSGQLPPEGARALDRLPFDLRLRLFADVAPSLAGTPREAITRAARETGLIARAERRCASRSWRRRLRAARLLTVLGGGEDAVPPLLADDRVEVRTQAAEWAAEHPTDGTVGALVAMLGEPQMLARFTVQDALTRLRHAASPALALAIRTAQGDAALGALRVAVSIPEPALATAALERCADPDPRVRACAARVLGSIGGESAVASLEAMLDDDDARARAAAAASLGQLRHWPVA